MAFKELSNITDVLLDDEDPILSNDQVKIFTFINYTILIGVVSSFGVIFNILTIVVFFRQGFSDSINISLLGLAVADVAGLLPLIWVGLCYNPWLELTYTNLDLNDLHYLFGGWPHVCFSRVTGWLTAFITFERYVCIAFPLKVKAIITPRRTVIVVASVFVIVCSSVVPVAFSLGVGPTFSVAKNRTVIGLVYSENGVAVENVALLINAFLEITAFVFVILSTIGLVQKFLSKTKWRNETSSSQKNEQISRRDKKVVKMIILISGIFIASYFPIVINVTVMAVFDDYGVLGRYKNIYMAIGTCIFFLEAVNSTVNIFVYLRMSSRFRETFVSIFCTVRCRKDRT
ncbi:unnamed protein product [Lymnaea stagnalis]|uniref:G-protein coupled receptors family 1 profile domain-containing protein n=1 Tax=Lymnaea stagnalis TaxID=6523 RepID=A0AAV2HYG4_LYMST